MARETLRGYETILRYAMLSRFDGNTIALEIHLPRSHVYLAIIRKVDECYPQIIVILCK